jgi:hypothetical protein
LAGSAEAFNGVGENKLGKILMQVRSILSENKSKDGNNTTIIAV